MYSELTRGYFCVVILVIYSSGQKGEAKEATLSNGGGFPDGSSNLLIGQYFPKIEWKWKKLDRERGSSLTPPGSVKGLLYN